MQSDKNATDEMRAKIKTSEVYYEIQNALKSSANEINAVYQDCENKYKNMQMLYFADDIMVGTLGPPTMTSEVKSSAHMTK